jgi:hypothetical protein
VTSRRTWFECVQLHIEGDVDPRVTGNVDVMVGTTDTGRVLTGQTRTMFNVEDKELPDFTLLQLIAAAGGADASDDRRPGPEVGEERRQAV